MARRQSMISILNNFKTKIYRTGVDVAESAKPYKDGIWEGRIFNVLVKSTAAEKCSQPKPFGDEMVGR